jgi:hypothetical protein
MYTQSALRVCMNYRSALTLGPQVLLPLVQGTLWTLALHGWKYWNRTTQLSGSTVGARVRRWWWGVNNWPIDKKGTSFAGKA